ncbi:DUF4834 family protein [Flavobacterium cerinum]|uniref:DUF4834 family protein n=1 Tax=Flavobacterium cerinum TaxID=2502784 RepID=A0ABY5IM30_9FLAO|nr:DUF4834 family protein [Flavobacterium cerinum]UUC43872.1 DUF4834 family protein [Flavobacterium cerinum]
MDTASLTGLVKVLLWIIVIYYALKFVTKLLAPYFLQQVVKKAEENFQQQQQYYNQQQSQQQNTQTNFSSDKPREKKKVGEYIDFEEIE